MTRLEKAFEKMTPDQRKKNVDAISEMMGMPVKKNNSVYKKRSGQMSLLWQQKHSTDSL